MELECFCCDAVGFEQGRRVTICEMTELTREEAESQTQAQRQAWTEQNTLRPAIVCETCYFTLSRDDLFPEIQGKMYHIAAASRKKAAVYTAEKYARFLERKMFSVPKDFGRKKRDAVYSGLSYLLMRMDRSKAAQELPGLLAKASASDPNTLLRLAACAISLIQDQPDVKWDIYELD
jgi:hypothetical protein